MLSRYVKTFLPVLALAAGLFAGCNGEPPQLGQITVNPDKVEVNKNASVAVATSEGSDIMYKWEAQRGKVSNSNKASAIYTAPPTVGTDKITVTAINSQGSTSKSTDVEVEKIIDLNPPQYIFKPNTDREGRAELILDIGGGVKDLVPQKNQTGIDLTGYRLEISLQGDTNKQAQLYFKDCSEPQPRNSYRYDRFPVGPDLIYDPVDHSKAVDQISDFTRICYVGVKVSWYLPGKKGIPVEGVKVLSARLVKVR